MSVDAPGAIDLAEGVPFAARHNQHRNEQMLAGSATAAICAGPDNLIVSWNTAAERLFGHSAAQAIGKPLSIIIPERLRAAHEAGLARAVQSGTARLAGQSVDILALHADGSEIPVDLSLSIWFEAGKPMFGALLRDIADRQSAKQRLEHLAHCDTLTSLPNRNALHQRLVAELASGPCSLLLLDLDGFKHVNDSLGHSVGDQLLIAVARRLNAVIASSEFIARLGGDEFAILVPHCEDPLVLDTLAKRVFEALQSAFHLAGQTVYVGTSIGIASATHANSDWEQLLVSADLALYSAKSEGGGTRMFFAPVMQSRSEQRHRLSSELHDALSLGQFDLLYQPQVALDDTTLTGVEALLRWRHPVHGVLPPPSFIELLEHSPVAEDVGDWIVDTACAAAARWIRMGWRSPRVGINLFAAQLRSGRLMQVVLTSLERHAVSPDCLKLEITENTVLQHDAQSTSVLRALREMGVGVAFDDFGTGFASLSLLQRYPLTRLKIDRGFVSQINRDAGDAAIVQAVIGMATALDLEVIAEGVETAEQEAALVRLGCSEAQGFRYGRPMSQTDIESRTLFKSATLQPVSGLPRERRQARS
ncbi:putative bifunctional diguanylate cyclase/phosphodiesterase [Sphingomonas sp. Leaf412]|uniref:putative bifunctional diguanylate cyclase/phosphodiesterase n=1 Tax=Sphingomonas sp. Leaf412 TaxID=1736370 RepID=UPI001F316003|nr:EAL domain-containing protein [Sphingomonas sp. Leaf412]